MISLPEIGLKGLELLQKSKVLVIGAGALGSTCAMYLAGAGIGELTVADFDTIDISNLPRQLFYETNQCGGLKAETLVKRMQALNNGCKSIALTEMITSRNGMELFKGFDFVVDATDNPASKFNTDKICKILGSYYCIGGVAGFRGQVMSGGPGYIAYSDIFSPDGVCSGVAPCSVSGVIGPAAGVVACIQASETIKHLTGAGAILFNKLFSIDLLSMSSSLISV